MIDIFIVFIEIKCDLTWDEMAVPSGLRNGSLAAICKMQG